MSLFIPSPVGIYSPRPELPKDWQTLLDTPKERGKYLLQNGLFSDCQLIISDGEKKTVFKVHRLILASASPIFQALFYESPDDTVDWKDLEYECDQPEAFRQMLK